MYFFKNFFSVESCSRASYKFYFLLSLIEISKKKDTVFLEECGIIMLVLCWIDLSDSKNKYRNLDKLKR
jgi:hypothetical protein